MDLTRLAEQALACNKCGLRQQATQVVFGEGNPRADLMFIGEGPGAEEDRQGRPFVGAAGQLLTRMIGAMGWRRDQVYIANIVKCRPPGNRVPKPEEARACLPWLYQQIDLVQPKIIVLLGSTALQNLIKPGAAITQYRGRWFVDERGIWVMPTYHPAALLRDPAKKAECWQDLQQVMAALEYMGLHPNSY
ncbi:MAG: uracil-DNA glycosylase [Bacillota bacterium]